MPLKAQDTGQIVRWKTPSGKFVNRGRNPSTVEGTIETTFGVFFLYQRGRRGIGPVDWVEGSDEMERNNSRRSKR